MKGMAKFLTVKLIGIHITFALFIGIAIFFYIVLNTGARKIERVLYTDYMDSYYKYMEYLQNDDMDAAEIYLDKLIDSIDKVAAVSIENKAAEKMIDKFAEEEKSFLTELFVILRYPEDASESDYEWADDFLCKTSSYENFMEKVMHVL